MLNSEPTYTCVVLTGRSLKLAVLTRIEVMRLEIGIPMRAASSTMRAVPLATAMAKAGCWSRVSGTRPLPEKFLTSEPARKSATTAPARVASVARFRTCR